MRHDLNVYARHRHYNRLSKGPKKFLDAIVIAVQETGGDEVSIPMKELQKRIGYKSNTNMWFKDHRELLMDLGFFDAMPGQALLGAKGHDFSGSTPYLYRLKTDWMKLSDDDYDRIIQKHKDKRKMKADERHEEKMQNDPAYAEEHVGPWSAQDCVDYIERRGMFRRTVRIY